MEFWTVVLTYDEIPTRIPGTGDIFSAIVIGHLLKDVPLIDSTARAMRSVRRLIDINKGQPGQVPWHTD